MKVAELIAKLQTMDQAMEVYRIDKNSSFLHLMEEDIADLELGEACDEKGNPLPSDEYPDMDGKHILCINWTEFEEE